MIHFSSNKTERFQLNSLVSFFFYNGQYFYFGHLIHNSKAIKSDLLYILVRFIINCENRR